VVSAAVVTALGSAIAYNALAGGSNSAYNRRQLRALHSIAPPS
jgi:hypothetical protein